MGVVCVLKAFFEKLEPMQGTSLGCVLCHVHVLVERLSAKVCILSLRRRSVLCLEVTLFSEEVTMSQHNLMMLTRPRQINWSILTFYNWFCKSYRR